jgi:ribosomal protein S18 acetylase RimI-like enzyme
MQAASVRLIQADLRDAAQAAALLAVLDAYAADPMGAGQPLSPGVRSRLIPALRGMAGAFQVLALAGDAPVGAAVCFTGFSTFRARPLTNVHDLAVLGPWRGRGIGRRLLAAVEDISRRRCHCKVTLEVREDNPAALTLYRSAGFGAGLGGGSGCGQGAQVQYLFMEKRLSGGD